MAYLRKEEKAELVKAVKAVLPKGWKATFALRNYSTLVCTIRSAPFDLNAVFPPKEDYEERDHMQIRGYALNKCVYRDVKKALEDIITAMESKNYNNSDAMSDYFDVGYYTELRLGEYGKPFVNK